MKTDFKKSFTRDLKRLKDKTFNKRVAEAIEQIEQADVLLDVTSIAKLKSSGNYYRIRIGNYRIGLKYENETVVFVRFLHRKEIYRYFP